MDYSDDEDQKNKEPDEEEEVDEEGAEPSAFLQKMKTLMVKSPSPPPTPPSEAESDMKPERSDSSFSTSLKSKMMEKLQAERTWEDDDDFGLYIPESEVGDITSARVTDPVTKEPSAVGSTGTTPRAQATQIPKPTAKAAKPFVKYVSAYKTAPVPPSAAKPESASSTRATESSLASRPHSPPQRPKSPLPDFISQFKGLEWFDKYFPNANENTFPKPWNVNAFVTMIVRVLRIADFRLKVDVVDALLMLHMQEGITNPEPIYKVLYSIYNHHTHPPTCTNEDEKAFIRKGLEILQLLGAHDREFYIELVVQFLEGDKDIRSQVMENLQVCGLKDPHKYFTKELDSWDVWNLDEKDRQGELRRMCKDWLERWMTSFKIHIQDTIDRLKRGQSVVGRATPSQMRTSPAPPPTAKGGILKKPALPGLVEEGDEEESTVPGTPSVKGPVSVMFEKPPDASSIENATFIEAINYFCDMELEKYVDHIKSGGRIMEKGAEDKNTVLVLPKIPGKATLVRLGETHTSKCRPSRETSLSVDLRLPPITTRGKQPPPGQLYGFPPCIQLPMKPVMMNPFPSSLDQFDPMYTLQQPVLLMLKTSQKYFVHDRSYVPPDLYGEV